ncbi:MAG: PD-(D/E)XK nuclease family protein [Candidatus Omnitrophica bacterium]|nr:PD-(D/E)XK nuclease family protein [Candidatus Omnitrophota bacterium]
MSEKKKKTALSAHSLSIFIECPRCFYLSIKKKTSRPRGPMPSIATGIDLLIKEYFEFFRKKNQLPPFLSGKVDGELISNLKKTYYYDLDENKDFYIWGHLDEVIKLKNGLYVPLDHKTRASKPKEEPHDAYKFQLGVYSLLLKKENNGEVVDFGYLVYYYPEKGLIDYEANEIKNIINFSFELKEVKLNINEVNEVINDAIKCLENDKPPESSRDCEYCKWIKKVKFYYLDEFEEDEKLKEDEKIEEISFPDGKLF